MKLVPIPVFAALRLPLLPVTDLLSNDIDLLTAAATVKSTLTNSLFRAGLQLASPRLIEAIDQWNGQLDAEGLKLLDSVERYRLRASSRATPFGFFASTGEIVLGTNTQLEAASFSRRAHVRFDLAVLEKAARDFSTDPKLFDQLPWRANTTWYRRANGSLGFIEITEQRPQTDRFALSEVPWSDDLAAVLDILKKPHTGIEILAAIRKIDVNTSLTDARSLARQLVETGLLVSDLIPVVVGEENQARFFRQAPTNSEMLVFRQIMETCHAWADLNNFDIVNFQKTFDLAQQANLPQRNLFQVDTYHSTSATLSKAWLAERAQEVARLQLWQYPRQETFSDWSGRFTQRFEDAWIPLMQALDPVSGIPFAHGSKQPTDDWSFPLGIRKLPPSATVLPKTEIVLMDALRRHISPDDGPVYLDELAANLPLYPPNRKLPFCSTMQGHLLKEIGINGEALLRFLYGGSIGPDGAFMHARFMHGDAAFASRATAAVSIADQAFLSGGFVVAEIGHFPSGRLANVCSRPVIRDYVICVAGHADVPSERIIEPRELLVTVRESLPRLYCPRLGKEVIPRLSNAHSVDLPGALDAYVFLGTLARYETQGPGFQWPDAAQGFDYLPRVEIGQTVVRLAQWKLQETWVKQVLVSPEPIKMLTEWMRASQISSWISIKSSDNILPLNLQNPIHQRILIQELRRGTRFIEECPLEQMRVFTTDKGDYCTEIVATLTEWGEPPLSPQPLQPSFTSQPLRRGLDSDCLFIKIYANSDSIDRLLSGLLGNWLLHDATQQGGVQRFYFVRYADPRPHLRLRIFGAPSTLWAIIFPKLLQLLAPARADGAEIVMGEYVFEHERYGGDGMAEAAETLFHIDSFTALQSLLSMGRSLTETEDRTLMVIRHAIRWLRLLSQSQAIGVLKHLSEAYQIEFALSGAQRGGIGELYRIHKRSLLASWQVDPEPSLQEAVKPYQKLWAIGKRLDIFESFLHMAVNRMFRTRSREQEVVLYELLRRSALALSKSCSEVNFSENP